jgi:transaldolase
MTTKLDSLKTMTTVVADTGDIAQIARFRPTDCTTNPSLILKAAEMPAYADRVSEAVHWASAYGGTAEGRVAAACDRLAIGFGHELTKLVPGRVSTEVDADLSFDTEATVAKGRAIIAAYEALGVPRGRILIKIASTFEGIRAARVLQSEGIDCNLTLLFSLGQAVAAARAGAFLISPFVGRILDWHVKAGGGPYTAETDPGVVSVRRIFTAYKAHGFGTVVMGASFRNIGEIEALAGCDRLTIAPALLDELQGAAGELVRALDSSKRPEGPPELPQTDEKSFRRDLNEDAMATEKLSEGIRLFARDLRSLRAMMAARLSE